MHTCPAPPTDRPSLGHEGNRIMWMNEWEVRALPDRFDASEQPNAERGARILLNLLVWTNNNSDGWAYWRKPSNAAERLMDSLQAVRSAYFRGDDTDMSAEALALALRPIKAFLTRQKVDADTREWIVDPDAAARKAAEAARVRAEDQERALRGVAAEYAFTAVREYVAAQRRGASPDLMDVISAAYLAGAKR